MNNYGAILYLPILATALLPLEYIGVSPFNRYPILIPISCLSIAIGLTVLMHKVTKPNISYWQFLSRANMSIDVPFSQVARMSIFILCVVAFNLVYLTAKLETLDLASSARSVLLGYSLVIAVALGYRWVRHLKR